VPPSLRPPMRLCCPAGIGCVVIGSGLRLRPDKPTVSAMRVVWYGLGRSISTASGCRRSARNTQSQAGRLPDEIGHLLLGHHWGRAPHDQAGAIGQREPLQSSVLDGSHECSGRYCRPPGTGRPVSGNVGRLSPRTRLGGYAGAPIMAVPANVGTHAASSTSSFQGNRGSAWARILWSLAPYPPTACDLSAARDPEHGYPGASAPGVFRRRAELR
jgi:hypothetical protein